MPTFVTLNTHILERSLAVAALLSRSSAGEGADTCGARTWAFISCHTHVLAKTPLASSTHTSANNSGERAAVLTYLNYEYNTFEAVR